LKGKAAVAGPSSSLLAARQAVLGTDTWPRMALPLLNVAGTSNSAGEAPCHIKGMSLL
jgi:hypothetical protein